MLEALNGATLRGLDGQCPFGLCDGSGFVYDEESNTASDCRCRPQRVALAKARSLSAVIPRRYRDVAFDRPPVTDISLEVVRATRKFTERIDEQGRSPFAPRPRAALRKSAPKTVEPPEQER